MHVLVLDRPGKFAGADLGAHFGKSALDRREVAAPDHAAGGEHAGVRERAGDVVHREALVERNRGGKALHECIHGLGKTSRPGFRLLFPLRRRSSHVGLRCRNKILENRMRLKSAR